MPKIKALFLTANPRSANRLAIDEEMRAIEQKLRTAEYRNTLVFQSAWAVRPDDLLHLLNQHRPDIVHFSGHGSSEGLSLAGNDGKDRLVTTRALKALFTTLKDNIRLVLLNACYSREQAQALVEIIDCVIGIKERIGDDAAIAFASSFYRAIGFGRSIREAYDQGVTSLLLKGIAEEDIPELLVKEGVNLHQIILISDRTPSPPLVPAPSTGAIEVFSLYADVEADQKLLLQLETHFATMQQQGLITTWNKGRMQPGEDERLVMSEHLNRAKIILFMVSPDFMASQYREEVEHAMAKRQSGTHVIPIILRPVDWKPSPFGGLMPLPANGDPITKWSNRDEAFLEVAQGIRTVAENLKIANPLYTEMWAKADKERDEEHKQSLSLQHLESQASLKNNPFSLPPLDEEVIGRERERELIAQRLKQPKTLTFLFGEAGIGKSMLANEAMHLISRESPAVFWIPCENFPNGNEILLSLIKCLVSDEEVGKLVAHANFNELRNTFCAALREIHAYVAMDDVTNLSEEDIQRLCGTFHDAGISAILTGIRKPPTSIKWLSKDDIIEISPLSVEEEGLDIFAYAYAQGKASSLTSEERSYATTIIRALGSNTLLIKQIGGYAGQAQRSLKELTKEVLQDVKVKSPPNDILNAWYSKNLNRFQKGSERLLPYIGAFASRSFLRSAVIELAKHMAIPEAEEYFDFYVRLLLLQREKAEIEERFQMHSVIYIFAREHFNKDLTEEERCNVYRFLASYYSSWAHNVEYPYYRIQPEELNIIDVLKYLYALEDDVLISNLCYGICCYWGEQRHAQQAEEHLSQGISAVRRLLQTKRGDVSELRRELIEMLRAYGQALRFVDLTKTVKAFREVVALKELWQNDSIDPTDMARAYDSYAEALMNNALSPENKLEIEELFNKALMNYRKADDLQGELHTLSSLGELQLILGFPQKAIPIFLESLKKWRALRPDKKISQRAIYVGMFNNLTSLSEAERRLDHYRRAKQYAREAVDVALASDNTSDLGIAYALLGQVYFKMRNIQAAQTYYQQGIDCSTRARSSLDMARTLSFLGESHLFKADDYANRKRFAEAEKHLRLAKDQYTAALKFRTGQDIKGEASDYQGLARAAKIQARCGNDSERQYYLEEAISNTQKSLRVLEGKEENYLRGQAYFLQGQVEIELGNVEEAKRHFLESCSLFESESSEYQQVKEVLLALAQHET